MNKKTGKREALFELSDSNDSKYKAVKIKPTNRIAEETIRKMMKISVPRAVRRGQYLSERQEEVFCAQARFMENFEDSYPLVEKCSSSVKVYSGLNIQQLRCYFTWRTKARRGEFEKTYLAYIHVYIFEIINNIGVSDPIDAAKKLAAVWHRYKSSSERLNNELRLWFKDYYACNDFQISFKELVTLTGTEEFYPELYTFDNEKHISTMIIESADYDIRESNFVKKDNIYRFNIERCLIAVVKNLSPLLNMYGTSWERMYLSGVTYWIPHVKYNDAIYWGEDPKKTIIEISETEYFKPSSYYWFHYRAEGPSRVAKYFFGYITKSIEAKVRDWNHYRYKLSPSKDFKSIKRIPDDAAIEVEKLVKDRYFDAILTETTLSVLQSQNLRDNTENELIVPEVNALRILNDMINREPYKTFAKLHELKNRDIGPDQIFYLQALTLKNLEDDFNGFADFEADMPRFTLMNNDQLRTYLTWRTKVSRGQMPGIPFAYVKLYVFELINGLNAKDPHEGFGKLAEVLRSYDGNSKFVKQLIVWIRDFYICHMGDASFFGLVRRYKLEGYYPYIMLQDEDLEDYVSVYEKLSSHKILKGKLKTEETIPMINDCVRRVFSEVERRFLEEGMIFSEILTRREERPKWVPFKGGVYSEQRKFKLHGKNSKVKVMLGKYDEFVFEYGRWSCYRMLVKIYGAENVAGYILKGIDSNIRDILGMKRPDARDLINLREKIKNVYYYDRKVTGILLSDDLIDMIGRMVSECIQENHSHLIKNYDALTRKPVKVAVDMERLGQIREEAEVIRDKLSIALEELDAGTGGERANGSGYIGQGGERVNGSDDESHSDGRGNGPDHVGSGGERGNDTDDLSHGGERTDDSDLAGLPGVWAAFRSGLSEIQCRAIRILLDGGDVEGTLRILAVENRTLTEVMIEEINEIALDSIGDALIDTTSGEICIYDDYIDEVRVNFDV
ncbi:hypothetical protein FACS1894127_0880 [Clostridia bacterium]|nr:hypothetical protein FACS1894127_0880 [Clostridia bacterium]